MRLAGTASAMRRSTHPTGDVAGSGTRPLWLNRQLSRFGAAGALFASLCCLGFSALVSLLTAIGLGFLVSDAALLPVLLAFLGVYVAGLFLGWRRHGKLPVLVVGVLAAAANYGFIFVAFDRPLAYAAVVLLVGVSVWDLVERRRVRS